jgi:methyl-accepting chemotaxis protein
VYLVLLTQLSLLVVIVRGINWPVVGGVVLANLLLAFAWGSMARSESQLAVAPVRPLAASEEPVQGVLPMPSDEVFTQAEASSASSQEAASLSSQLSVHLRGQNDVVGEAVLMVIGVDDDLATMAQTASQASSSCESGYRTTSDGMRQIEQLLSMMTGMDQAVQRSSQAVEELSKQALGIGEIVGTINTIARRTNMLAINAGIVAAQAGDRGQGFAVIAMEIRQLAAQTSNALESIRSMLEGVQRRSREVVLTMDHGARQVQDGVAAANQAGSAINLALGTMTENRAQVDRIMGSVSEIKAKSDLLVETLLTLANQVADNSQQALAVDHACSQQAKAAMALVCELSVLRPPIISEEAPGNAPTRPGW